MELEQRIRQTLAQVAIIANCQLTDNITDGTVLLQLTQFLIQAYRLDMSFNDLKNSHVGFLPGASQSFGMRML